MNRMKYTYTPRRRCSLRRSSPPIPPLALAPLLVLAVIGGYFLVRHGDDKPNTAAAVLTANCQPGKCAAPATSVPRRLVPAAARGSGASAAAPAPQISGTAAFVLEDACDAVLYQLSSDTRSPPASVTKIMTALVAAEHSQMTDPVPITVDGSELSAYTDSTVMGLQPGWTLSMRDLLYGLLLPSGADAAIQIAKHV